MDPRIRNHEADRPQLKRAVRLHEEPSPEEIQVRIRLPHVPPLLLEACPSFLPSWHELLAEKRISWGLLRDLDRFAEHLVWLLAHNETDELAAVLAVFESVRHEGDHFRLRHMAMSFMLKAVSRHAVGTPVTLADLRPFLPASAHRFWEAALAAPGQVEALLAAEEMSARARS